MYYLKLNNGVPEKYSLSRLRTDYPNVSFPDKPTEEMLAQYDVYPYTRPAVSVFDTLAWRAIDGDFTQVDGAWTLPYQMVKLSQSQAESRVRHQRTNLLADCDWTQVTDSALSAEAKAAWVTYRQALRDVTSQADFPYNVTWPTPPE